MDSQADRERAGARAITDSYRKMAYDGVAVGPLDLAAGVEFLRENESAGLPWISANIYDHDGTRTFPPFRSIERAGLKIGVIALTDIGKQQYSDIVIRNWEPELEQLLPSMALAHDLVILLTTLPYSAVTKISSEFPDVKIIVGADRKKGNVNGFVSKHALFVQTADQGKYLGRLSVNWNGQPWGEDHVKKLLALRNNQMTITRQLIQLKRIREKDNSAYQRKKAALEQKQIDVDEQIKQLEATIETASAPASASSFSTAIIPLTPATPEDLEIRKIIDSVKN